jgi:hypothetical protein
LSTVYGENKNGNKKTWHWDKVNIKQYLPPYYNAMVCIVHFSKQMMKCISDYANKNKTLFF